MLVSDKVHVYRVVDGDEERVFLATSFADAVATWAKFLVKHCDVSPDDAEGMQPQSVERLDFACDVVLSEDARAALRSAEA